MKSSDKTAPERLMHWGMMACCAVMLLPIAGFFLAGGTIAGLWGNAGAFLPLLLCGGAHLLMHKVLGKSCHGKPDLEEQFVPVAPDRARSVRQVG